MRRLGKRALSALLAAVLAAGLLGLPACAVENDAGQPETAAESGQAEPAPDPCPAILEGMSTEEKISQMVMPAFRYYPGADGRLQPVKELPPDVSAMLQKRGFAGVIFFVENSSDTAKTVRLVDAMQAANASVEGRPQLLTAIDQEGGLITRLEHGTQGPGNMALGAAGDGNATREMAGMIGQELAAIGLNCNFAPVMDVNSNPANPVIGTRSFSDDPRTAAEQGVAFMQGLREAGVTATLKHFPGHGDTATDSHTGLPCINKSYDQLKQNELVPFQACIDAGAEAVMTAHIQYPQIETETYPSKKTGAPVSLPATLSKTILTDILRGDMGFDGVIVTDALEMDAIREHFDRLDAARLAIEAGADILLMPVDTSSQKGINALDQYITDVARLADEGAISMDKVNAAVLRILHLKNNKGLLAPYGSGDLEARASRAASLVGSQANHDKEWAITKKAITLVKNENNVLPRTGENQRIAVLTPYNNEVLGLEYAVGRLRDEGKLPQGTAVTVSSIRKKTFAAVKPLLQGADHVIVVSEANSAADLAGTYSALVDRIIDQVHAGGKTVTVMSAALPYDAARFQKADALLIAWNARSMTEDPRDTGSGVKEYGPCMPAALYLALSPDESPMGKLPVNIPALDGAYHFTDTVLYERGFGLTYPSAAPAPSAAPGEPDYANGGGSAPPDPKTMAAASGPMAAFYDLDPNEWYREGITWALEKGVMNGVADGQFSPGAETNRAMIVTMLRRLEGSPKVKSSVSFRDVPAGEWFADSVNWASANGIVTGYDAETFGPLDSVTREQLATILYRCAQTKGMDVSAGEDAGLRSFDDAFAVSDWAVPAVRWACGAGILHGRTETTLVPYGTATRAETATMLQRFAEMMKL